MLIAPFNAIPSWEGYEYQGHIALYVTLKTIKTLLEETKNITAYSLEIEGAEDFSIKDGDNYLSLHQVKSGTLSLDEQDKFCFIISVLQYQAEGGYFHISPRKVLPNNFVDATCKHLSSLYNEFSKEVKSKTKDTPLNSSEIEIKQFCKDNIIIEDISPISAKGSHYNILKFYLAVNGLAIDKNNVEKALAEIVDELKGYEEKLYEDKIQLTDSAFLSKYDVLFENSSSVKQASYLLVEEILKCVFPNEQLRIDAIYSEFVYGQLLINIKNKISESHETSETTCKIPFTDIFAILSENYQEKMISVGYQYFMVWKSIRESIDNYPLKPNSSCISTSCGLCSTYSDCNLYAQKELIKKISEDEINSFLYRLMLKKPTIGQSNNLPDDDLIHRLFTSLMKEIDILQIGDGNLIQAQKNGLFYRMTLNSCGEPYELQAQLANETENKSEDKLLLFETDILITDQLNDDTFFVNGINTMVLGEKEYTDLENLTSDSVEKVKKNCHKPKVMRLIDRKKAKEELNDD